MNKLYFILSVAGWAWLIVVAAFLVIRFKRTPGMRGTFLHGRGGDDGGS